MRNIAKKIVDILIENEGVNVKIMFMPYKIEMWDSMESVFQECIDRCLQAIVYPIQYMILDNHKISDIHMDIWSNDMCHYVFCDISKVQPDVVFFHYPFDAQNNVTTIPQEYYSSNLKKRGIKLAYLSYHGNPCLEHEMLLPAVLNSDYIFAYDEAEKQRYYDTWKRHNIKRMPKVFATGTPKIDAYTSVLNLYPSDDVLIVNSLGPYLNDESRIQKYTAIIEKEKGRNIIYRPHPLLLDTLKHSNLWRYQQYLEFLKYLDSVNVKIDSHKYLKDTLAHTNKLYCDHPASISVLCREAGYNVEYII